MHYSYYLHYYYSKCILQYYHITLLLHIFLNYYILIILKP